MTDVCLVGFMIVLAGKISGNMQQQFNLNDTECIALGLCRPPLRKCPCSSTLPNYDAIRWGDYPWSFCSDGQTSNCWLRKFHVAVEAWKYVLPVPRAYVAGNEIVSSFLLWAECCLVCCALQSVGVSCKSRSVLLRANNTRDTVQFKNE